MEQQGAQQGDGRPAGQYQPGIAVDVDGFREALAPVHRDRMLVGNFDSSKSDAHDWMSDYQRSAVGLSWTNQRMKQQLYHYLDAAGRNWIKTLELIPNDDDEEPSWSQLTWPQVVEAFVDHFSKDNSRTEKWERIFHEPQQRSQEYFEYVDLKVRAGREINKTKREIMRSIYLHLLPEYSNIMGVDRHTTITGLMRDLKLAAEQLVTRERDKLLRDNSRKMKPQGHEMNAYARSPARNQSSSYDNQPKKGFPQNDERQRKPMTCYNCGQEGHYSRNCRAPRFQGKSQQQQAYRPTFQPQGQRQGGEQPNNLARAPLEQQQYQAIQGPSGNNRPPHKKPDGRPIYASHIDDAARVNRIANFTRPPPPLEMNVAIHGIEIVGEIDTGSAFTCIDYDYYDKFLSDDHLLLATDGINLRGANRQNLIVRGIIQAQVDYEDKTGAKQQVPVRAIIVSELSTTCLLGRDFQACVDMKINAKDRTFTCGTPQDPPTFDLGRKPDHIGSIQWECPLVQSRNNDESEEIDWNTDSLYTLTTERVEIAESTCPIKDSEMKLMATYSDYFVANIQTNEESDVVQEINPFVFNEGTRQIATRRGKVNIGKELDDGDEAQLLDICEHFEATFSFEGELGDCNVLEHRIDTGDNRPLCSVPYRFSFAKREEVRKQVDTWLAEGVIRMSNSPWSSPIVLVPKKDGSKRLCVDLRRVNAITKEDKYPLPQVDDLLANLNDKSHFSSLDLNQGYTQIRLSHDSIEKTAFVTQDGLYEFVRMPFGLVNAPATFQRCMDMILARHKWNSCLVYLDDIIIFGKDLKEHNENLIKILDALSRANMTIKPSKCAFGVKELKFLGHIVGRYGLRMDPEKIKAIIDQKEPDSVTKVRSFIGMATYYRKFIKNFSLVAEPMISLLKNDVPFKWTESQQVSFENMKRLLTEQPVLCHFDHERPTELRTDACGIGLGAILLQQFPDNSKRVVLYISRKLSKAESNYTITEMECLAVVWAVKKLRMYLQGIKFKILTDHLALTWLKTKRELTARLMRWTLELAQYDYEIVYRSGVMNKDADFLSRYPVNVIAHGRRGTYRPTEDSEDTRVLSRPINVPVINENVIKVAQRNDEYCKSIIRNIEQEPGFQLVRGLLIESRQYRGRRLAPRVVIPDQLMDDVLFTLHDDPMSGHGGIRKTIWKFNQRYFNPKSSRQIKNYIRACHYCQTKKDRWTKRYGMLNPIQPAARPFERIGIDTLGPFRKSYGGYEKIVVITDYFSRWAITKAIVKENAQTIAQVLIQDVFLKFGAPEVILSDRGKSFRTELMREIYNDFMVKHVTSTAYHPQTNGLTERFNKTLSVMMSMYVSQQHRDWDDYLPYATFAYNTVVQDSTDFSPYYLLYGQEARMTFDIEILSDRPTFSERMEKLHVAREQAILATQRAQTRQKNQYDKRRYNLQFQVGDKVLVYRPRGYIGQTTKLRHPWEGPFEVVAKYSDLNYLVKRIQHKARNPDVEVVNITRMKPYYERPNPIQSNDIQNNQPEDDQSQASRQESTTIRRGARMSNSNWLYSIYQFMLIFLTILDRATSHVIWTPTNIRIPSGRQNLTIHAKYRFLCEEDINLFTNNLNKQHIDVNHEFNSWCLDYAKSMTEGFLGKFCKDNGTTNPNHPRLLVMTSRARRLQEAESTPKPDRHKRSVFNVKGTGHFDNGTKTIIIRDKRFVLEFLAGIAIATTIVIGTKYFLEWVFDTGDDAAALEEVQVKQKAIVESNTEILKQIEAINRGVKKLAENQEEITKVQTALGLKSDFRTQQAVGSVIYTYMDLNRRGMEIAKSFNQGRVHPNLFETFGYNVTCLESTCPLEEYSANNCEFDALKRIAKLEFTRRLVRDDVEILKANPFAYMKLEFNQSALANLPANMSTSSKLWMIINHTKLKACYSQYEGPRHLASKSDNCANIIRPDRLEDFDSTTIPIVYDNCLSLSSTALKYSDWMCKEIEADKIDESVQIKVDEERLHVYCPYQQYQINNGPFRDCVIDKVMEFSTITNLTIRRHQLRTNPTVLTTWTSDSVTKQVETKFVVPVEFKAFTPDLSGIKHIQDKLVEVKNGSLQIDKDINLVKNKLNYKWSRVIQEKSTKWGKWVVVAVGLLLIAIIIIVTMFICARQHSKANRGQQEQKVSQGPTSNLINSSPPPKYPLVYFTRESNE